MLKDIQTKAELKTMARYLDPRSDLVFKKIFGNHPHLLKSFLNALLPLPKDGLIETLVYLPSELSPQIPILKRPIVDVKCTDVQGRIFIVEMQIEWTNSFMQRMLFGASKAYVSQLQKGEDYHYLNPVYGLGLLASPFDRETDDFYHHYKIVNIKRPERELKGLQLVFVEIPKFKPETITGKKLQVLWLRFLSEVNESNQEVAAELMQVPEIKEAILLAEESAYSKAELEAYDKYWDSVSSEKSLIQGARRDGKEEGRAEGRAEGLKEGIEKQTIEIARRLKAAGVSIMDIAKFTGMIEEEIIKLP